jgi:putative flippase GtrA
MKVVPLAQARRSVPEPTSDVEMVVPVYNEEQQLAASITALRAYLDTTFPFTATITIADNASTDGTWRVATALAETLVGVSAIHLGQKGRGRALRAAWSRSTASVVAYMDVDLATGLDALLPLVAPLLSGHSDVAIGTRLVPGAHVVRGVRREFLSRGYNLILRAALRSACTDAQCGFKAMRREAAGELLPLVEDNQWFFDTEVLVTAQRLGLRIHEVPVDWVDDQDSRVDVVHTAVEDLRGVIRLLAPSTRRRVALRRPRPLGPAVVDRMTAAMGGEATGDGRTADLIDFRRGREGMSEQARLDGPSVGPSSASLAVEGAPTQVFADELLRFAGVGAASTVIYAALFAALEPELGSYLANGVAIGLCSLGNTAAHRGMAGAAGRGLDGRERVLTSAALFGVSLTFTTGALAVTRALGVTNLIPTLGAVTVANAGAAVIRFGILRTWVFRPEFGTRLSAGPGDPGHWAGQSAPTGGLS